MLGVGIELPAAVDLPGEDQAGGWLPHKNSAPVAFATVHAAFVPPASHAGFQDRLGHVRGADVVFVGPPAADGFGENPEGLLDRNVDCDGSCEGLHGGGAHGFSCFGSYGAVSATFWNDLNASSHTWSSQVRNAATPSGLSRYTLRVPSASSTTRPPSLSTRRCCETAGRLTGRWLASSPTEWGRRASSSKIARRVGSPRRLRATGS